MPGCGPWPGQRHRGIPAYDYRDEGIAVLAARRPGLHGALLVAKAAGHWHVIVDGTLIHTDRVSTPGPIPGVDLWWSGKHHHHGGNIQVVSAPDGWPLWTFDVRSGREHDVTAARADPDLLARIADWVSDGQPALADLATKANRRRSRSRSRNRRTPTSPQTSRPPTPSTARRAASANAPTPCSRPPPRPCAATAAAPGGSANHRRPGPAPPQTRPHNVINNRLITHRNEKLRGKA